MKNALGIIKFERELSREEEEELRRRWEEMLREMPVREQNLYAADVGVARQRVGPSEIKETQDIASVQGD